MSGGSLNGSGNCLATDILCRPIAAGGGRWLHPLQRHCRFVPAELLEHPNLALQV